MIEATIQSLDGVLLTAVIAGLLFVEEVGLPLFLAPGDVLLALGGVAIAAGRVHPALFVGVALAAIVGGALLGRELFSLLGLERLMRAARRVHAERHLQRAASLLHRSGWRAIFVSRLIPGLRVHTTQIAGVSHMRRVPFLMGLLAATAVYVAAFVGLGAALGRPALQLIHQGERQAVITVGVSLAMVVFLLLVRARIRRAAEFFELSDWRGAFLRWPTLPGLALIPGAVGINYAGHALATTFQLPLFLDTVGTVVVALIAGPWVGGIAGLLSNLVSSSTIDPIAAPYSVISLGIGLAVGLAARRDWKRRLWDGLVLWGVCFWVATLGSTPLNLLTNHGQSGVAAGDALFAWLREAHVPTVVAAFLDEAIIDLPDKLISVLVALLIYQALPERRAMAARPVRPVAANPAAAE